MAVLQKMSEHFCSGSLMIIKGEDVLLVTGPAGCVCVNHDNQVALSSVGGNQSCELVPPIFPYINGSSTVWCMSCQEPKVQIMIVDMYKKMSMAGRDHHKVCAFKEAWFRSMPSIWLSKIDS